MTKWVKVFESFGLKKLDVILQKNFIQNKKLIIYFDIKILFFFYN